MFRSERGNDVLRKRPRAGHRMVEMVDHLLYHVAKILWRDGPLMKDKSCLIGNDLRVGALVVAGMVGEFAVKSVLARCTPSHREDSDQA